MKQRKNDYKILFDHPEYIIVSKPAGLLSVPERFTDEASLKKLLRDRYGVIYAVHRLDQFTSGLMLFAKNPGSHKTFNLMFEQREVVKKYRAIATGRFSESEGMIDLPIMKLDDRNEVIIHKKGKPSQTQYRVLEQLQNVAFVELDLLTGRTHQIRIHLMAAGHPLIVDSLYGGGKEIYVSEIKGKSKFHLEKGTEEYPILSRTPLHAFQLHFEDPFDKVSRTFEEEMPKDMRAILRQYRKWDKS